MIAARGQGIITSIVLQSGDLDEIDWEWVGGKDNEVQSNYFGKGDLSSYDRGAFHSVSDPFATSHTYTIEWTSKKIDWSIDGQVVRTLKYEDAKGGSRFPQTPMEIKLGTWVAGLPDAEPGTIDWGGGYTDFSQAPFNAWYRSVSVVDYAGGDSATEESIKEYVYSDNSGSWESIDVIRGDGSTGGDDDDDADLTTSIHHSSTNQASTTISATSIASTSTGVSSLVSQPSVTSTSHTAPISTDSGNSSTTSGEPTEPTGPPSSGALVNVASLLNIAFAGLGLLVIRGL
jgi:beta-glucanase (GH16 family)